MTEFDPNNHTHVMLRQTHKRMDAVLTLLQRVADDVHDLKIRVTSIEESMAGFQRRMDRFEDRLDRIERRAGLADDVFREIAEPFKGPDE
jgi:predicted  nucleic acid-binding Zn-ribbon protein